MDAFTPNSRELDGLCGLLLKSQHLPVDVEYLRQVVLSPYIVRPYVSVNTLWVEFCNFTGDLQMAKKLILHRRLRLFPD